MHPAREAKSAGLSRGSLVRPYSTPLGQLGSTGAMCRMPEVLGFQPSSYALRPSCGFDQSTRKGEALADQEVQVEFSEETMLRGHGVDRMHRGAAHDKKERSKKLVSGPLST